MKLLKPDPKPKLKPQPKTESGLPNSASSSSMAPPQRRTRDLPNLSDCHCCGRRTNRDNPRDRLQAMDSVWRIVLLCRKCRKTINSGQTCSYCFREAEDSRDLCQCGVCERRIHRDCVKGYGDCSPWCYLGVGLEDFGVCVDCWVPDLLKNSIRVCRRSENKRRLENGGNGKRLLKKVVKDGECGNGLEGNTVMKNLVDLENGELDSTSKKDKDSSKDVNLNSVAGVSELESWLNSSPRILGNCLSNSGSLDAPRTRVSDSSVYSKSVLGNDGGKGWKIRTCADETDDERMERQSMGDVLCNDSNGINKGVLPYHLDRKRRIWQPMNRNTVVSEASQQKVMLNLSSEGLVKVDADRRNMCKDFNRCGQELLSYKRSRVRWKACQVNGSYDMSEGSSDVNRLCGDANGLNVGLLCYRRDRKRKKWTLNDDNNVASEASHQKFMLYSQSPLKSNYLSEVLIDVNVDHSNMCREFDRFRQELVYKRTRFRHKVCHINGSIDISEGSTDVDSPNDVNELNLGLLTYKRDRGRRKWQLTDENAVASEANQEVHLDHARMWDPMMIGADLSEGSFDFEAEQSNLCALVGSSIQELLCYKRSRFRQKSCQENGSVDIYGPCNSVEGLDIGLLTYKRDRNRKRWQLSTLEASTGANADQSNLCPIC